ncbi:microsomal triglyceride transfer protein-like [Discoglossus pictus]
MAVPGVYRWKLLLLLLCCSAQGYLEAPSLQPGVLYQYNYTLDLNVGHISQPAMPGTRLRGEGSVRTHLVWRSKVQPDEQLVHVQIQDFKFQHLSREKKNNGTSEETNMGGAAGGTVNLGHPILFHWKSGKVLGVYSTGEDNSRELDLKRGLVSLFQFQPLYGTYTEEDVSGRCLVTYDMSKNIIKKSKDLHSCTKSPFGFTADHKVFGVSQNFSSKGQVSLINSTIQLAVSDESYIVSLHMRSHFGTQIASRQQLELKSTIPGPAEVPGDSIEMVLKGLPEKFQKVEIGHNPLRRVEESPTFKNYWKTSKKKMSKLDVSKTSTTKHFHMFVKMMRHTKKRDILLLLQQASPDMVGFYIDAAVAAQSLPALEALDEFLDFSRKKQVDLHEKFLYAAAFAPYPSTDLLNLVLDKLNSKVTEAVVIETGILVVGTLIGKLCKMNLCETKDVVYAKETLLEGLSRTEDDSEIRIYLLSLRNAQLPDTIPLILEYAEDSSRVVSHAALSALSGFTRAQLVTKEVKETLRRIFHQTDQKSDKTGRLLAAEILVDADTSGTDIINILLGLENMDKEASKLLISKIQDRLSSRHTAKKIGENLLNDTMLNNYDKLSKLGKSTTFSGRISATRDLVSSYGLDLLFSESGLLKRSSSDITLSHNNQHLKTMQVSIVTQGLGSLLGDGEEDDDVDASVGMSAILFDVQLRPVVFFKGYMDLMSKVFSSSGEPTSVVKGNVLLIDHLQWLPMQSGLQAIIECQGGLGLEILANIDVNIWEQESKTSIKTKAGLVLEFKTQVDSAFLQTDLKGQVDADISTNFDSVMRLGSPVLMCLELRQHDTPYRETYIVSETFPEKNITWTVRKGRKSMLWGRDYPLHQGNSEMCKSLLGDDNEMGDLRTLLGEDYQPGEFKTLLDKDDQPGEVKKNEDQQHRDL